MTAGAAYWVRIVPTALVLWGRANPRTNTRVEFGAGTYFDNAMSAAFSVQVNPVPEPSALAALGLGVGVFVRRGRKA